MDKASIGLWFSGERCMSQRNEQTCRQVHRLEAAGFVVGALEKDFRLGSGWWGRSAFLKPLTPVHASIGQARL
ncbi:MAG: hypothetical protein CL927_13470 [Deltaproteobacteria bacterium]|nr:hypothetical protein [Deltaproteobacteria bacterium]HCH62004.1 hypothetical protein [Deltaproteobacteria bacterium]